MEIKTSSLVFRLWSWIVRHGVTNGEYRTALERANLCDMVIDILGGGLMFGLPFLFAAVLLPPALTVLYCGWVCLALLAGYVPRMSPIGMFKLIGNRGEGVRPTYGRILGLTLGRFRLYPYHVAIAYLVWLPASYVIKTTPAVIWERHHQGLSVGGSILLVLVFLGAILFLTDFMQEPTVEAYLRAKKERVCPRVTFVDDAGVLPKDEETTTSASAT